jgi:hypothetical protein
LHASIFGGRPLRSISVAGEHRAENYGTSLVPPLTTSNPGHASIRRMNARRPNDRVELQLLAYRTAVRAALVHLGRSEDLYRRIAAVAAAIDSRSWPWAASPSCLRDTDCGVSAH